MTAESCKLCCFPLLLGLRAAGARTGLFDDECFPWTGLGSKKKRSLDQGTLSPIFPHKRYFCSVTLRGKGPS
ncbi:E3 ISG15--protein ligase Herc6 [Fusarium oxysporum f. sp. albedinis]|nr:E3 ISG15--protein ligase Herc6 [Fusarium oxysporum f. sp. albedinis]